MSAFPPNPFLMPGLGQSGETASNPLVASMEMMRQAFTGLTGAGGLTASLQMTKAMDPAELEKKIADLKAVENWLKLNLSMLSSTIQGMEVQLATIVTLKSYVAGMTGGFNAENVEPQTNSTAEPKAPTANEQAQENKASAGSESIARTPDHQVTDAAKAWWEMLQTQFNEVARATADSLAKSPIIADIGNPAASSSEFDAKPEVAESTAQHQAKSPTARATQAASRKAVSRKAASAARKQTTPVKRASPSTPSK